MAPDEMSEELQSSRATDPEDRRVRRTRILNAEVADGDRARLSRREDEVTRYFTTYWTSEPWQHSAGGFTEHAASNEFRKRGVGPGDHVYVVHYRAREVFLGARIIVERVTTKEEAASELGMDVDEIWDARDHILADPASVQRLHPGRAIPRSTLRELTFVRDDGTETGLKFDTDGAANQQTLRTVRELTEASARALDSLIAWTSTPPADEVLALSLSRGPCLGECPVYTVSFLIDDIALWEGRSAVERVGAYLGHVPGDAFADLARIASTNGFFRLADEYPPPGTDLPDHRITVGTGYRDKSVIAWAMGEPPEFQNLAARIDEVADAIDWMPADPEA
jgi:hypothetical protein